MRIHWISRLILLAATLTATSAGAGAPPAPDPQAVLARARVQQAVAEYGEAADGFEAFVRLRPQAAEATEALEDAITLRLGMGQEEQANADVDLFLESYGASLPAQAAQVSFALAAHEVERDDYAGALKRLAGWGAAFDRSAPLDLRMQAHALLGHTYVKLNDAKKAEPEYGAVRDLWRDPAASARTVQAEAGDDRRLAKALNSVGEAIFFFAERKRHDAETIRFPEYRGKGDKDEVLKHLRTRVAEWVQKKHAAIEEAERAYRAVVDIQPVPPPRWVIAAASRDGQLWGRFVAEFRAAPIPREWKGHGPVPGSTLTYDDLRGFYYKNLDEASEPQRVQAKAAFKTCVDDSVKYQYADEYSRRCHEWLTKHFPGEYHPLNELLPRFQLAGAALEPAPLPDPR